MRASGDVVLAGFPPNDGIQTADEVRRFNQGLAPTVTVQKWDGEAWDTVTARVVHEGKEPISNVKEAIVTLPRLSPGAYRILRRSASSDELSRVIWIDRSLPAAARE
jgi:hypothetical protein